MPFFSNNSLFADVYLYFTNHSIVPIKSDFLACIAGRKKKKTSCIVSEAQNLQRKAFTPNVWFNT